MNKKVIEVFGPTFDMGEPYFKTIEDKKIATDFAEYYRERLNKKQNANTK